jgi:hypothetical protein
VGTAPAFAVNAITTTAALMFLKFLFMTVCFLIDTDKFMMGISPKLPPDYPICVLYYRLPLLKSS